MRFYSLKLPQKVDFSPSELIEKIARARMPFQFIIEKNGTRPVELVVATHYDILDTLSFAVAGKHYNSEINTMKVLRTDGYLLGATMKRLEAAEILQVSSTIQSTMLALRDGEKFRVTLDVIPFRRRSALGKMRGTCSMSLTILYSGSLNRLIGIFPLLQERKLWKLKKSWKLKARFRVQPFVLVDYIIPSLNEMNEGNTIIARRHVPQTLGDTEIEGVNMVLPGRSAPYLVDSSFFTENTLVFGGTRTGKSTFLCHLISALAADGRPICLIDPHGDLVSRSMKTADFSRDGHDVIFVDPVDCPVGLNPFEVFRQPGEGERISSLISESIGHVVKTAYGSEFWGPRMDYLLHGLLLSVADLKETNFVDLLELVNSSFAARELADSTSDQTTRNFLLSELPKAREDWWMAIKDKIGRIIVDERARTVLCRRKGNVDLYGAISTGRSIFADINVNSIGRGTSALIGAILMSMFWVVSSSLRTGATIIVDEAQMFPPEIIQEIASGGRKFGVNIILASQSPSNFERSALSGMASNFRNSFAFRLSNFDAPVMAQLLATDDVEEITNLPDLTALAKTNNRFARIEIEPVTGGLEERAAAIGRTKTEFGTEDDSQPSPFASLEGQLFDVLQIVRAAERQGKQSLSGLEETGALMLFGYGQSELSTLIENARSMGLIQKAHLKLTQRGRNEMMRLQGGILAGDEKHRSIVLSLTDILDSMHLITYIPRQKLGVERPDIIVKTASGISSTLFYMEVEVATKYQLDKRRKKVERAERNGAIPVFVFDEPGPPLSAIKKGEFPESVFAYFGNNSLKVWIGGEWKTVESYADILRRGAKSRDALT